MRAKRLSFVLLGFTLLAACREVVDPAGPSAGTVQNPVASQGIDEQSVIVRFRDDVADPEGTARGLVNAFGGQLGYVYRNAIRGFSARIPVPAQAALAQNPNVLYVEPDGIVTASRTTQSPATWGLDRIDQHPLPLNNSYSYDFTGAGVDAYVFDTGIRYDHVDFGGRAVFGADVFGGNGSDCNGHGTHVSGTIGGTTWGVAKQVRLIAVRVLDCGGSGSFAGVAAGIDWAVGNHNQAVRRAVGNLSLGGGANQTVDDAVRRAFNDGIVVAIAAGNSNADACSYSPARVAEAITLGSTTSTDARSSFSNWGSCVDLFAPGSNITSAWYTSSTATAALNGTSMASPHAAGAAALYLAENPSVTPQQVRDGLYARSTKSIVTGSNSANNHLLYTLNDGGEPPPPPPPPPPGDFVLDAFGYKSKGLQKVQLTWSGQSAPTVDVFRNGTYFVTVGATADPWIDNINQKGGGSYTYQVCNTPPATGCSNTRVVSF